MACRDICRAVSVRAPWKYATFGFTRVYGTVSTASTTSRVSFSDSVAWPLRQQDSTGMRDGFAKRFLYEAMLYVTNHIIAHIPSHTVRKCYYRRVLKISIGADSYIFMPAYFETKGKMTMGAG